MPPAGSADPVTYRCATCGSSIDDEWALDQCRELNLTEGTVCRDCAEQNVRGSQAQAAFERIRTALSPENRRAWDDHDEEEKLYFLYMQVQNGNIEGGSPRFHHNLDVWALKTLQESDPAPRQ